MMAAMSDEWKLPIASCVEPPEHRSLARLGATDVCTVPLVPPLLGTLPNQRRIHEQQDSFKIKE